MPEVADDNLALANFMNQNFSSLYTPEDARVAFFKGCPDLEEFINSQDLPMLPQALEISKVPHAAIAMILLEFNNVVYDYKLTIQLARAKRVITVLQNESLDSRRKLRNLRVI